ncbi:hypothetical protein RSOL_514380 [Rhizoctonia solani AG-3 Rhs1AP]|uniref:Uncharacterized protein n=2 Tax=Rhizoctonia solani AG-3 TaxID=1086053 RepID=A0A074RGR3_9AGAM|nr:hypothetical protein RSOL_514380 [Rhizoctonia solani AG-3 Rhs1AP]KEP45964.1 hypothetical protein V565_227440 [Rhizoctonia solani 123E]
MEALTRSVAKSLFGVKRLTTDATPFYYKKGRPDFFPTELTNRNGYCKPYPHWDRPFANNYPWFSVYLSLWRSMIPKDSSAFEMACRGFTDRQILVLLHDGPFKSLVTGWNTKKKEGRLVDIKSSKGPDKEERKAIKRGVSRTEAKTFMRVSYRPEIKKIAGPKWNPMWVKPTMSPEPSDGEGGKLVLQPRYRARWVNTVYTAIDNAERARELAKPGVHRPPAKRTIQLVDSMPPVLYTGTGSNKKVEKYPLAMFSKRWRATKEGAEWMEASTHLIDHNLSERPDISGFVKAHPDPVAGKSEVEGDLGVEQEVAYEGEDEDEDEAEGEDEGEGDVEFEGDVEVEDEGEGEGEGKGEGEGEESGNEGVYKEASGAWAGGDFPIDPELPIQLPTQSMVSRPRPRVIDGECMHVKLGGTMLTCDTIAFDSLVDTIPAGYIAPAWPSRPLPQPAGMSQELAVQTTYQVAATFDSSVPSEAATSNEAIRYPSEFQQHPPRPIWADAATPMPPPPTLSQQTAAAAATLAPEPAKQRKKRTKAQPSEQNNLGPSTSTQDLNPAEEPPKKRRRGRPPGSKNKKTLDKAKLAAESQQQR